MREKLKLVLLPSLKVNKISDNQIIFTKKLLDGVNEFQKYWAGAIEVILEEWATRMNRPDLLSIKIAKLDSNRELLVEGSEKSLAFASMHTIEKTFQNRISHIRDIAEKARL